LWLTKPTWRNCSRLWIGRSVFLWGAGSSICHSEIGDPAPDFNLPTADRKAQVQLKSPEPPMGSGKPVCNVATPSLPQPEITLFATGLRLLANLLPLPKAKSKMWTTTMRWETSKPSKLFSLRISLNYTSAVSETTKRRCGKCWPPTPNCWCWLASKGGSGGERAGATWPAQVCSEVSASEMLSAVPG